MSFYNWQATFSRQTGSQGEFCIVIGGKGIGKTFGLRLQCVRDFIKGGFRFVELSRTKDETKSVMVGYFDRLQYCGYFKDYVFKTEKNAGYIALKPKDESEKPNWSLCCYFVSLTVFQREKKRTYSNVKRVIFDEAIIDSKDRYHRYLPNEFFILANILDSIFREQPNDKPIYRVYLLGNSCNLVNLYLQHLGVNRQPEYGYSFFNGKHTLLHYVEPMDAAERQAYTLVGRMLSGTDESDMVYNNKFETGNDDDIDQKPSNAKFAYGLKYLKRDFGIWTDYKNGLIYVTNWIPKDSRTVYALTKRDSTLNYALIQRNSKLMQALANIAWSGGLRYQDVATREMFWKLLELLGVK